MTQVTNGKNAMPAFGGRLSGALATSFIIFALFALASRATSTSRRWRHVPRHRRDAPRSAPEIWDPVYNWTDRDTGVTTLYNRTGEVLASA